MDATLFSPILIFKIYLSLTSKGYSKCQSDACCELWGEKNKQCKDGCRSGYFGHRCVNRCKYPNYGKGCQFRCFCIDDFCNHKTGCEIPDTTNSVRSTFTKVAPIQIKNGGEFELSLFKVFLISAVSSISVSVIIAFVVWKVRKHRLSNLSSSENACRWTNQSAYPVDVENYATQSFLQF